MVIKHGDLFVLTAGSHDEENYAQYGCYAWNTSKSTQDVEQEYKSYLVRECTLRADLLDWLLRQGCNGWFTPDNLEKARAEYTGEMPDLIDAKDWLIRMGYISHVTNKELWIDSTEDWEDS